MERKAFTGSSSDMLETLLAYPTICRLLCIGLASHLQHYDAFDAPAHVSPPMESSSIIPPTSVLRQTPLFTNPRILDLKQHVAIAMPWESHYKYFKSASGLPPHVILYAYVKSLDVQIQNLPNKLEELLDRRSMAGPVFLDQITRAVENGPRMSAMAGDIAALRRIVQDNNTRTSGEEAGNTNNNNGNVLDLPEPQLHRQYMHPDGIERRVPPSWTIPKLGLHLMYAYWHCGDPANGIPEMKHLLASDVSYLGKGAKTRLSEMRKVMTLIDREAISKGCTVRVTMNHKMANSCFHHGESAIRNIMPNETMTGRMRNISNMTWGSIVRNMHKKRGS